MAASFGVNSPAIALRFSATVCPSISVAPRRCSALASCRHCIAGNSAATVLPDNFCFPTSHSLAHSRYWQGHFTTLAHGNHRRQANPATAQPMFSTLFEGDKRRVEVKRSTGETGPAQHFRQQNGVCPFCPSLLWQPVIISSSGFWYRHSAIWRATNSGAKRRSRRLQQYSFLKPKSHKIAQPVQRPFIPMLNAVKDIDVPFFLCVNSSAAAACSSAPVNFAEAKHPVRYYPEPPPAALFRQHSGIRFGFKR